MNEQDYEYPEKEGNVGDASNHLIACPDCGHMISRLASVCPSCGRALEKLDLIKEQESLNEQKDKHEGSSWTPVVIILIFVLFIMGIVFLVMNVEKNSRNSFYGNQHYTKEEIQDAVQK